jgi:MarR family transcriptional regulator, organic hydroperoxide resistance regulator
MLIGTGWADVIEQIARGDEQALAAVAATARSADRSVEDLRRSLSAVRRRADAARLADAPATLVEAIGQLETTVQEALAAHRRSSAQSAAEAVASTPLQRELLLTLTKGPAVPKDLARTTGRESESVSRALNALLARGLVAFEPDPADRRRRIYGLTAAGEVQAADAVTYVSVPGAVTSEQPAADLHEILRETLSAAVALRRGSSRRRETLARLEVVQRQARTAHAPLIELEALQETIVTLRQARRAAETSPHMEQLDRLAQGSGGDPALTMMPALGFLEYELGRAATAELSVRAEHLITSSSIFRRLARGGEVEHERWRARQGWALVSLADNFRQQSELGKALAEAMVAETLFEQLGDPYGLVRAKFMRGFCYRLRGQFADALEHLKNAYDLAQEERFAAFAADALMQLGEVHRSQGDLETAADMLSEAHQHASVLELPLTQAFAQSALAAVDHVRGREGDVTSGLTEAHQLFDSRGHRDGVALNLRRRAVVARQSGGDLQAAGAFLAEARALYLQMRSPAGVVACDVEAGHLAIARDEDRTSTAVRLMRHLAQPTFRHMLALDPWVPPLVLELAGELDLPELRNRAEDLVEQNARTLREHQQECQDGDGEPPVEADETMLLPTDDGDRRVDPMVGEPRCLRPEAALAAA